MNRAGSLRPEVQGMQVQPFTANMLTQGRWREAAEWSDAPAAEPTPGPPGAAS